MLQLNRQDRIVPPGQLGQAIIREDVGADLVLGQILQSYGRYFLYAQKLRRFNASVSSDYPSIRIGQNRIRESECLDAVGNLPNLPFRVSAGIAG